MLNFYQNIYHLIFHLNLQPIQIYSCLLSNLIIVLCSY